MLPHIIPFFSVLTGGDIIFEIPGIEAADSMAEAMSVLFENCLLFIFWIFKKLITKAGNYQISGATPITGMVSGIPGTGPNA